VSERALIEALNENRIQGAVLDVFEKEPLPEDNPLWEHPDVLVTPHVSALSFPEDIVKIFAENYRRFTLGRSLQYVIDFAKGY
jgi:phosphoglycerate dehydrogenase-like enzyme